jgi:hypothetical protein
MDTELCVCTCSPLLRILGCEEPARNYDLSFNRSEQRLLPGLVRSHSTGLFIEPSVAQHFVPMNIDILDEIAVSPALKDHQTRQSAEFIYAVRV